MLVIDCNDKSDSDSDTYMRQSRQQKVLKRHAKSLLPTIFASPIETLLVCIKIIFFLLNF